jgi:Cd2+/Zn2+-exporting ATPase
MPYSTKNDEKNMLDIKTACCGHSDQAAELQTETAKMAASVTHIKQGVCTDIRIMQMDCPTEEKMIRHKLKNIEGIYDLEFKLLSRVLSVTHEREVLDEILQRIKSLGFEPEIIEGTSVSGVKGRSRDQKPEKSKYKILILAALLALVSELVGWFGASDWLSFAFAISAIALCGSNTYKKGWICLINYQLNINALMSIAVTGAFLIGHWPEAAMVMVLFTLSEIIEQSSLEKASSAIEKLFSLSPDTTAVLTDGQWLSVKTEQVQKGDIVRVRAGERISLDGVIVKGDSSIDQSPITGESIGVDKTIGDQVYAGTVNGLGLFEFKVSAVSGDTTLASIIKVVEQAQNSKAPIQRFIDKFASVYTPIVFVLAVLVAVVGPLVSDGDWMAWLYKALVLLVIACPCALVISTPITIVSGLTAAAKRGILIKGGEYLEQGRHIKWLALDKTGTITEGKPALTDIKIFADTDNSDVSKLTSETQIVNIALALSEHSDHPVAMAINQGLKDRANSIKNESEEAPEQGLVIESYQTLVGKGIKGEYLKTIYYLGSARLAKELDVLDQQALAQIEIYERSAKTVNVLMNEQQVLAVIAVADIIKSSSAEAIEQLHCLQVSTLMLSGDNEQTATAIANEVGIKHVSAMLLPEQKLQVIVKLQKKGVVAMVGDGINDAPALAQADIGFAMGVLGSDTAIETANVALMDDDLRKISQFITLSTRTHRILVQNISFAIGVKALFLVITLLGYSDMWMAVFADVGASVLVVANGLRLLNDKQRM